MRVIKTHLKTVLEVKVYPASAGGTTEDVARYVIHDFFDVADIASRHVSRLLLALPSARINAYSINTLIL